MTARASGDLQRIAAAQLEAELGELRKRTAGAEAARARLASLDAAVGRQQAEITRELEAPVAGPVFDRWGAWAERRRSTLAAALARDLALAEAQRRVALTAFGRAEALRQVAEKAARDAAGLRKRRERRPGS